MVLVDLIGQLWTHDIIEENPTISVNIIAASFYLGLKSYTKFRA